MHALQWFGGHVIWASFESGSIQTPTKNGSFKAFGGLHQSTIIDFLFDQTEKTREYAFDLL